MQNKYERCPNCMQALTAGEDVCPHCQFDVANYETMNNCLQPFTVLQNKYMLGRVIGVGGFGITYIGWDLNLQTYIAIKEYFPESIASRDTTVATQSVPNESKKDMYDKGLKRYVEEAQSLSKFYQLQGIVSVKDFFYENGTGYIVMEYINGINLKEYLRNAGGKLDEATVLALMKPVLESLYQIHNAGMIHRDISPDNIMVDRDNKIKLIDFGSARGQSAEAEKTYTVILKHGFAPSEQYHAKGNQGPWTDIYSLCATMYRMLTGQNPPNSIERMESDTYVAPSAMGISVSPRTEQVLQKGLAVRAVDRYQNIGQMLADLYGNNPISPGVVSPTPMAPVNNSVVPMNPASMSQQSMHLNIQPQGSAATPAGKNKKTGIIVCAILGAALIIALICIFWPDKDDDKKGKKDTETTTESTEEPGDTTATTEEPGTTETNEPSGENPGYVAPTEVSDNWRDYTISVDGTVYKLPMPYSEFRALGWSTDYIATDLAAGGSDWPTFTLNGIECTAIIYNYKLNKAPIEECYVVALSFDMDNFDIADHEIILSKGIQLNKSTVEDVKLAFGAPEYIYEDEEYSSLDYAGDTYEDGMDFEFLPGGVMTSASIANTAMPEGLEISATDIDTAPPAINAQYVAPTGPSVDPLDSVFTIDGSYYKVPVPVSEFIKNGWQLDSATDEYIVGEDYIWTSMEKNGNKINITIENMTENSIIPANGMITEISVESGYCNLEVIFPGGLYIGAPGSSFTDAYGFLGEDCERDDEYDSFIAYDAYYSADDYSYSIYVDAYSDPATDVITDLTYQYYSYD